MAFEKITDTDREGNGVSGLPNTPNLTPTQLQEQFDSLANLAIEKFNAFIEALAAASAAGNIGSANGTVQSDLTALRQGMNQAYQRLSGLDSQSATTQSSLENHINTYYSTDCVPSKLLDYGNRITAIELELGVEGDSSGGNSTAFSALMDEVDRNGENIQSLQDDVQITEGTVVEIKNELIDHVIYLYDVAVKTTDWSEDDTYVDYPFKAVTTHENIASEYLATVVFDVEQATAGLFAPVVETGEHKITFYANAIPDSDIVIPVIQLIRGCSVT